MKLTSDKETLAEYKVLILYILDKIGKPISNDALLNLVLNVTDINYFYFQQFLLDLLENKYIASFHKEDCVVYDITDYGKKTLELTQDIVPGITKLRVDSNFKPEFESFENEQSVVAEYIPQSENHFDICCKIIEDNETVFEVKTFAGSRNQAKAIVDNWKENASVIYPKILELLTEEQA